MGLVSSFIDVAKLKLKTRPSRITDKLLGIFNALSYFADSLASPSSSEILPITNEDIPLSVVYNDTITKIMNDSNAVMNHQKETLNNLLVTWNTTEQISSSVLGSVSTSVLPIDIAFPVTTVPALVGDSLTLAVQSFNSAIPILKTPPSLNAISTDTTVPPVYGKAYGLYVPGNETGEDGIRTNKNDGRLIVDGVDSFWEAEAVTLQSPPDPDVFTPQVIDTTELSLVINLTLSFKNPVNINSLNITPHNFAQSAYFDVTGIEIVSGGISTPVLTSPVTCFSNTRLTFPTMIADGVNISIQQNKGYFIKYSLARYRLGNNEEWIDFTGPELISRVNSSSDDVNQAISDQIMSAGTWIPTIWVPGTPSNRKAELVTSSGNSGYREVASIASHRKRWAVGIQDIDFGQETYVSVSEGVTTPYTMPEETTSIYLIVDDEAPSGTTITYLLSFDDGSSWSVINPINKTNQQLQTGYFVPQRIFINSDLSLVRKQNTLTGVAGYVNTPARQVRVRAILEKNDTTIDTPRIRKITPIFDTSVPVV